MQMTGLRFRPLMAGLVLSAGLLAGLVGSAEPPLSKDEISALDLARRIADHQPGLQLLDLRSQAEFDADHAPGAMLIAQWAASSPSGGETLVVYAERSIDADAVREQLPVSNQRPVLRLRGGFQAWSDQVLFPTLRADATAAQRRAFDEQARLSRYFGGSPRVLGPGLSVDKARGRRGC
jgi:rhodanese-related sulfurtransferase